MIISVPASVFFAISMVLWIEDLCFLSHRLLQVSVSLVILMLIMPVQSVIDGPRQDTVCS